MDTDPHTPHYTHARTHLVAQSACLPRLEGVDVGEGKGHLVGPFGLAYMAGCVLVARVALHHGIESLDGIVHLYCHVLGSHAII